MTGRHTVDTITSDALDQLYDEIDRLTVELADYGQRLQQTAELLRIAHETSNRSEAERAKTQAVIKRVRALAPDLELEATLPGMHDAAREAKRDASRRIRALIDQLGLAHNAGPSVAECAETDRAHWTAKYDR